MRRSSILMLAAAVVLGLFAVLTAMFVLRPAAPTVKTLSMSIVAAASPFAFGDKITPEKLKLVELPTAATPQTAYRTIAAAVADGKRIAQRSIALNEVIVPAAVSASGSRLSSDGVIQPFMRAVSVNVTESSDVGGLVAPGDHVDVFVTHTPSERSPRTELKLSEHAIETLSAGLGANRPAGGSGAAASNGSRGGPHVWLPRGSAPALTASRSEPGKPDPITDLLIQDVRVLALGQNTRTEAARAELVKTATLEVTPEQAAKLILGQQAGTLGLALRGASDDEHTVLASLRTQDLHDGPPIHLVAPARHVKAKRNAGLAESSVVVIRGAASTNYSVPGS